MITKTNFVKKHRFLGIEYDWAAIDNEEQLGYFSSAGLGPIPKICEQMPLHFDNLFETTIDMTTLCNAQIITENQKNIDDWFLIAQKGIFAYDWNEKLKLYELIAKPKKPISFRQLNKDEEKNIFSQVKLDCNFNLGSTFKDQDFYI